MDISWSLGVKLTILLENLKNFFKKNSKNGKFEDLNFIYEKFIKKIAIYPGGHGIVINTLEILPQKDGKVQEIKRFFDISDGCKEIKLPSFDEMRNVNEKKRFKGNGFWYISDKECDVIPIEDLETKKKFAFKFRRPLNKNEKVTLSYAFSVECMYPIDDKGKLDKQKLSDKLKRKKEKIEFSVSHPIKYFEYELAFRGIEPQEEPILKITVGDDDNDIQTINPEVFFDPFYKRYRFILQNLDLGYKIKIYWSWQS